jgi:hypothetical protein
MLEKESLGKECGPKNQKHQNQTRRFKERMMLSPWWTRRDLKGKNGQNKIKERK